MAAELSTFAPFRLTICGIPELDEHCAAGVTHVLSILDPDTPDPPAFAAFAPHHRLALRFYDIIETLPDRLAPETRRGPSQSRGGFSFIRPRRRRRRPPE